MPTDRPIDHALPGDSAYNLDDARTAIAALIDRVSLLETLIARTRGPRDDADVQLLVAIARVVGSRRFTSADVLRHARVDADLSGALLAADIDNTRQLGKLLQRLEAHPIAGLLVVRLTNRVHHAAVWRVGVLSV